MRKTGGRIPAYRSDNTPTHICAQTNGDCSTTCIIIMSPAVRKVWRLYAWLQDQQLCMALVAVVLLRMLELARGLTGDSPLVIYCATWLAFFPNIRFCFCKHSFFVPPTILAIHARGTPLISKPRHPQPPPHYLGTKQSTLPGQINASRPPLSLNKVCFVTQPQNGPIPPSNLYLNVQLNNVGPKSAILALLIESVTTT